MFITKLSATVAWPFFRNAGKLLAARSLYLFIGRDCQSQTVREALLLGLSEEDWEL